MTLSMLESLRNKKREDLSLKNTRVVVGMATCGIAAGAQNVMDSLQGEIKKRSVPNVNVVIAGCLGICRLEPIVEVIDPDGSKVTYVKVDSSKAARIVTEHIVNGRICTDLTINAMN